MYSHETDKKKKFKETYTKLKNKRKNWHAKIAVIEAYLFKLYIICIK